MPELPEVETVRRGLDPVLTGQIIVNAQIRRPDLRWPFPDRMAERLEGYRIERLRRRSKYLLADLSSGESLLIHLGMSGRILIHSGDGPGQDTAGFVHKHPALEKHDHVILDLESGARIVFNDPRRFGAMDLLDTATDGDHKLLAVLGPEPLGNGFDAGYFAQAIQGKRSPIKTVLLDQRLVAGLGNIYVCEALHRARISPTRLAGKVSKLSVERLVPIIRDVLSEAIEAGGSSLKDYRQTDGDLGYFQHNFRAYGREGEPCPNVDCDGTIFRIVQSARSTFYCPQCQR